MCAILISKALRLARVNERSQFYLPPTRLPTSMELERAILPLLRNRRASPHISRSAYGRRLSWPRWLGEIPRWFTRSKTTTHSSTSRGDREWNLQPSSHKSNALTTRLPSIDAERLLQVTSTHVRCEMVSSWTSLEITATTLRLLLGGAYLFTLPIRICFSSTSAGLFFHFRFQFQPKMENFLPAAFKFDL